MPTIKGEQWPSRPLTCIVNMSKQDRLLPILKGFECNDRYQTCQTNDHLHRLPLQKKLELEI